MASQLILDRTDPGVDELVSSWKDGGEYEVTVKIRQDSSSASVGNYTVTSIEADEEMETEDYEKEMPEKEMMLKKPMPDMEDEE